MKNVLIWGSKSQARIIECMINEQYPSCSVKIIFDPFNENSSFKTNANFSNNLENLVELTSSLSHFIVCVGNSGYARFNIAQELKKFKLTSLSVISDHAYIDNTVHSGEGVQVMPGVVIHKFVKFGDHCIFNTNSSIDHECVLGKGINVMPGSTIAGRVKIEDFCTIGSNATVLPDVKIGKGSFIGAGSVIVEDVSPYSVMVGVPGKYIKKNNLVYDNVFN